ncbi:MAG: DUF423 domain-containing protein [Bacteroidia bacterium]|nr:DUF423 domain-containing protein [Bacteroidia bacterium]
MKYTHKIFARLGFLLSALAVFMGAFGTHVLRELISESELNTFDTGVRYQMFHALAIILISLSYRKFDEKIIYLVLGLFIAGIVIFSGSLYLLATRNIWGDDSFKVIGAITPLGGLCFIGGWLVLYFKGFLPEDDKAEGALTIHSKRHKRHHRKTDSLLKDSTE